MYCFSHFVHLIVMSAVVPGIVIVKYMYVSEILIEHSPKHNHL